MSKFKHAALALGAASLMAVQAHATEVQAQSPQAVPVATFSQADINTMFDQAGQSMQLVALSGQEMKETEGAWARFVVGGFAGGLYNGISYYNTPNRTFGGWTTAIGSGVVGGAVGGIRWWSAPIWGGGIAAAGGWAGTRFR
jgi:hypothetical protein